MIDEEIERSLSLIENSLAEIDRLRAKLATLHEEAQDEAWADFGRARLYEAERNEALARAERAEAQLFALREAAAATSEALSEHYDPHDPDIYYAYELRTTLADTAAAAEAYTRRIQAEALREAARMEDEMSIPVAMRDPGGER